MDEKLRQFIDHSRDKGLDDATVRHMLLSAGWRDKDIAEVFCARDLDLPIPEPVGVGTARDAFFHLLTFTALYTWATSLILLFIAYINFAFPDPAWRTSYDAIEEALSSGRVALLELAPNRNDPFVFRVWSRFNADEVAAEVKDLVKAVLTFTGTKYGNDEFAYSSGVPGA